MRVIVLFVCFLVCFFVLLSCLFVCLFALKDPKRLRATWSGSRCVLPSWFDLVFLRLLVILCLFACFGLAGVACLFVCLLRVVCCCVWFGWLVV